MNLPRLPMLARPLGANATSAQNPRDIAALKRIASLPAVEALKELRTSGRGLDQHIARMRLRKHGPNEIAHEKAPSWPVQLYHAARNPFVILLAVLAVVSYATGDPKATVVMGVMITVSVLLRFIQEFRSNEEAARLKAMVQTTATVLRRDAPTHMREPSVWEMEATPRELPIEDLVPGDIIHLAAGDMIPADIRFIASKDVFVNQSALTGESLPVEKADALPSDADLSNPLDLADLGFMGSNIVSGTATAVVVATGKDTCLGSLARGIAGQRVETSFDRGVNKVSWLLIRFMFVMVPIVFLVNGLTKHDWMGAFLFAVSIAVGLTPEMLPMIVTSNLAKGAASMSRQKVIVKRLSAIQNFGAMDILCTDKTGTLTQDRIFLEEHVDLDGRENERVLAYAYLNSIYQTGLRNQMDVAILTHSDLRKSLGVDQRTRKLDEIPFDFQRRRMSVVVKRDEDAAPLLICKGAVEEMLSVAAHCEVEDCPEPLTDGLRARCMDLVKRYNNEGFRVLAVGLRPVEAREAYAVADERDLVIIGFLAFLDPPKESAAPALAALREYGVMVKVLTGDNGVVTRKICKQVGLDADRVVLGPETDDLDDAALAELARNVTVFAKLSPLQKARLVRVLRAGGHTVGFLGDGINDAAALREADIGISVDSAVDIAKDSADIILLEKSLMVLEQGVIEGRRTFANIMKYLKMTASSNFGNMFSVLGASAWLPFLPMRPIHLLVQNLMYELTQIFIPWDRVDEAFLRQPRTWNTDDLARFMAWVGPLSSIFDYTTFLVMWFAFGARTEAHQGLFQAGWFVEGLLTQTLIVHLLRTSKVPFLESRASLPMMLATLAVMAAGMLVPYTHFGHVIGMTPMPGSYFLWLFGTLTAYCFAVQGMKRLYIRRFGTWL